MISYSTASITERLDQGQKIGEQFARIGMIIAAITGIVSPLSLITSYYGMNVQEFTAGGNASLFEVWEVGTPMLLVSVLTTVFIALWLATRRGPEAALDGWKERRRRQLPA